MQKFLTRCQTIIIYSYKSWIQFISERYFLTKANKVIIAHWNWWMMHLNDKIIEEKKDANDYYGGSLKTLSVNYLSSDTK